MLLRDDDSSTVLMRFLWDLPLGMKRKFIRGIDEHLSDRYPMFAGLSVDWPSQNGDPAVHPRGRARGRTTSGWSTRGTSAT